jgi:hypothetical protein
LIVLVLCPVVSGCGASTGSSQAAASASAPACRSLHFPYPKADLTLTSTDAGRTVRLRVGDLVEVDLLGSPSRRWSPIALSGDALLSLSTQAETPTVGTRLGEYCAVKSGHSLLSAGDGETNWKIDAAVGI